MTVVFFDIDGTLLSTGGAGRLAMESAMRRAFGLAELRDGVPYSGRTDRSIGFDLLRVNGLPANEENWQVLQQAYLNELPAALQVRAGMILPGIERLLQRLADTSAVAIGLLTGNLRAGAQLKLGHFGIDHFFAFGGFGDDHFCRDDVARGAWSEARLYLGQEPVAERCWVVGDTPLDVRCARAIGVRAVAVATGSYTVSDLADTCPDLLLKDFSDPNALLRCLL
jgi:phosphoglycolate phosphatase-like HAD superfamily hydrolase